MRVPWFQVATEVVDQAAPDLACLLDGDELRLLGGLMHLFKWGLGRCPDDEPPSANAVVRGPAAAKLVARAAGYEGDPDVFVDACSQVQPPLLERVPDGVRFRGLDRYDATWGKNNPAAWAAWKAAHVTTPPGPVPEPERSRAESGPVPIPKTKTETQTDRKDAAAAPKPKVSRVPVVPVAPDTPPETWLGDDFWAWAQAQRIASGYVCEPGPPIDAGTWWSACLMTPGVTAVRMKRAFAVFGESKHWEGQRFPFRGFMSQWSQFVPPQEVPRAVAR